MKLIKFVSALLLISLSRYQETDGATTAKKSHCRATTPKQNKEFVLTVYNELFNLKRADRLEKYFSPNYIQHNKNIGDGIEGIRNFLTTKLYVGDFKESTFLRSAAEGDLVFVHIKSTFKNPNTIPNAVIDIFRIECGLIKEHWDAVQAAKTTGSLNSQPFF